MGSDVRAGIRGTRGHRDRIDIEVLDGQRGGPLVVDRHQPPVSFRPEPHALPRLRAVPNGGEHLRAGQDELDRPLHQPRCERGQDDVRPSSKPGAEPASQIGNEHPHVALRQIEHGRQGLPHHHGPLGAVVHGQTVLLPARRGRKQPHGIVGLGRGGERLVVELLRRRERGLDVAALQLQSPRVSEDGRVGIRDPEYRGALLVSILTDLAAAVACSGVCATTTATCWPWWAIRLSLSGNGGGGPSGPTRAVGESWRVLMRDHREDARRGLRPCGVDARDRSGRDRRLHQDGMCEPGEVKSDGYGAAPVTLSGPSTRSRGAPITVSRVTAVMTGPPIPYAGFG